MKKEMRINYYNDENKLFNQPGKRYHNSESSYYYNKDDPLGMRGGRGGRGGRGRGGKRYVDYDDPKVNENKQPKETRELVDYTDLFG